MKNCWFFIVLNFLSYIIQLSSKKSNFSSFNVCVCVQCSFNDNVLFAIGGDHIKFSCEFP